jgi:hypothetical protein
LEDKLVALGVFKLAANYLLDVPSEGLQRPLLLRLEVLGRKKLEEFVGNLGSQHSFPFGSWMGGAVCSHAGLDSSAALEGIGQI